MPIGIGSTEYTMMSLMFVNLTYGMLHWITWDNETHGKLKNPNRETIGQSGGSSVCLGPYKMH